LLSKAFTFCFLREDLRSKPSSQNYPELALRLGRNCCHFRCAERFHNQLSEIVDKDWVAI